MAVAHAMMPKSASMTIAIVHARLSAEIEASKAFETSEPASKTAYSEIVAVCKYRYRAQNALKSLAPGIG